MDMFVNRLSNKENNNPVLVPTQYEIMQKEGIFAKTNNSLYTHHRFYYRKPRQSINASQQNPAIVRSNSFQSIHKEIEKIAQQLQSQQIYTQTQINNKQPFKERYPTQYSQPSNTQITEVVDMLEKENLLKIHQLKPCTPRKIFTPQINYNLPPSIYDNKSNDQDNSEKVTPLLKNKSLFKKTLNASFDKVKKINSSQENRQKRTHSQLINNDTYKQQQKSLKDRITNVIQNPIKILNLCQKVEEIQNSINDEQLKQLIQSDQFKIDLQLLINNSKGSNTQMKQILQNFMIEQVKKQKELQEVEQHLEEKKQNFSKMLNNYIKELKDKL
ncbi:unnamed protein product [Paramecium pentaurelia]|uniref:Uncharacterized protein n=1 Tax=Paramecium pentaurelia TaxID=43138 RepID=A0A8S1V0A1_9CILI|nr:unnamed protein product [Paramecium pentaurelia]